jgi:transposase
MEVLHQRCAGMDISKRDVKVCVRVPGARTNTFTKVVTVYGAMTNDITRLRDYLLAAHVTLVVMEATGDYWKPFYFGLESELNLMLVNPRHARNLPGRKTDVSDAQWLAELGAHGLVRGSFVPPQPIRQLRDLTRSRTIFVRERSREIQRLEKLLEDASIKLSSVATRTLGVSGRLMIEALIAGQRDPVTLASLAQGRLKNKSEQLVEALNGRFNTHHAFAAQMHLDQIDCLEQRIQSLNLRIDAGFESLPPWIESLSTIPGVSKTVAEIIIAETGGDMTQFPTPAQLASWAGVCPGHNESAGKVKSSHARPGNSHLKGALGIAAMASVRANGTYFQARYKRLTARRGPMRALVAIEHSIITAVWHMLTNGTVFEDLGENHFQRTHESSTRHHAINQLHQLGYDVELIPLATTP